MRQFITTALLTALGCISLGGTFTIDPGEGVEEDPSNLGTSGAVHGVDFDFDWISGAKAAKIVSNISLGSLNGTFRFEFRVVWNPSYSGEDPGTVEADGTVLATLTYTPYVCVFGGAGSGSVQYNGSSTLTSTLQGSESWIQCSNQTESVVLMQDDDSGDWFGYASVGSFNLTAANGATAEVKLIATDVEADDPLEGYWATMRVSNLAGPWMLNHLAKGLKQSLDAFRWTRAKTKPLTVGKDLRPLIFAAFH